jgi:WG containing repeat
MSERCRYIMLLVLACPRLVLLVSSCGRSDPVRHNHHCGYTDETGQFRINLPLGQPREFSEGLAAVAIHDRWGYLDTTGKFVIEPQFGDAGKFSEGLALVTSVPSKDLWAKTTMFGYIDKTGKYVIPPQFNAAGPFSDGLANVCVGPCRGQDRMKGTVGYIDVRGNYVFAPPVPADEIVFGRACHRLTTAVRKATQSFGIHGQSGTLVIPSKFIIADPFSEGLAAIQGVGFIDHSGAQLSCMLTQSMALLTGWPQ